MQHSYLFVYGTLRQGCQHGRLRLLAKNAEFIGSATFQGKLYMVRHYPGAVSSKKTSDVVHGEVYKLLKPELVLLQLDKYEECSNTFPKPTEYIRKLQTVQLTDGETLAAWVYLYNRPIAKLRYLPGGDFLNHNLDK